MIQAGTEFLYYSKELIIWQVQSNMGGFKKLYLPKFNLLYNGKRYKHSSPFVFGKPKLGSGKCRSLLRPILENSLQG